MADAEKKTTKKPDKDEGETFMDAPVPAPPPVNEITQTQSPDPAATEDVKPPKGAYIEDLTTPPSNELMTERGPIRSARPFEDEHTGVGGRYVVDPKTGERQPVYEKYTDEDGQTKYRKAP